jgi:aryl-alcohol dehydrogenase-like predicted oxidoreductase
MKYINLGQSELIVSKICLGTMTFGEQNTEQEAHIQLNYAIEKGINFIDTAEMYPIAARKETLGHTEKFVGSWFKEKKNRDQVVLATKIAGPNRGMPYIREPLKFTKKNILDAVNNSLKNLQTDYIDLYQLHWPERQMNMFGKRGLSEVDASWEDSFHDILITFESLMKEGKIRFFGVSNEAPWGLMRVIEEHKLNHLPKVQTIQNPYSLLNRLFEVGLAEIAIREKVGLLAYSPLGFGMLTGKHKNGFIKGSRQELFSQFTRYTSENCIKAISLYEDLAKKHDLSLTQMALAFVYHQEMVNATIIGATSLSQLQENIDAFEVKLTSEIKDEINLIHENIPNPAP